MSRPRTLVLVHGFLGSAINWSPLVHRFSKELLGWTFVCPDLLGHGRKAQTQEPEAITLQRMVDALEAEVPQEPFVALGHSFGLRPLLKLGVKLGPERMPMLIAEDATPEISDAGFAQLLKIFDATPTPFSSREAARQFFFEHYSPVIARFLYSHLRETLCGTWTWRFDDAALRKLLVSSKTDALWAEWESYAGTLALIRGEDSTYVTSERLEQARAARLPRSLLVGQIPQAGHWVHSDQPDSFVQEVVKMLKVFNEI
jgi:esterase